MSNVSVALGPDTLKYWETANDARKALLIVAAIFFLISASISYHQLFTQIKVGIIERKKTIFFPDIRRRIVNQILWIAVTMFCSLGSLIFPRMYVLLNFIQNTYQAWALFGFVRMLSDFVGGKKGTIELARSQPKSKIYATTPFTCCLGPCLKETKLTPTKLTLARLGVIQTCVVQPLLAFLAIFLQLNGLYTTGDISADNSYIYILVILVFSNMMAIYFITVIQKALGSAMREKFNVQKKFLLVKILVPLFSVQSLIISMIYEHVNKSHDVTFPQSVEAVLYDKFIVLFEGIPLAYLCYQAYPLHGESDYVDNQVSVETQTDDNDIMVSHLTVEVGS